MSNYIPNSFQTPNAIVDRLMSLLSDSELRVLLYATRHILGWRKKADSCRARISISNFADGFTYTDEEGTEYVYAGCGLSRQSIVKALAELEKYRILKKVGEPTRSGQIWELAFMTDDNVDESGLQERAAAKTASQRKQTKKGRATAQVIAAEKQIEKAQQSIQQTSSNQSVEQTSSGLLDRPVQSIEQTSSGLLNRHNETHINTYGETHEETQDSAPPAQSAIAPASEKITPLPAPTRNEMYDAVQTVWGYEAAMNTQFAQFLTGTVPAKKKNTDYYRYQFRDAPVTPSEVREWGAAWKSLHAGLDMLAAPVKVQESITKWRKLKAAGNLPKAVDPARKYDVKVTSDIPDEIFFAMLEGKTK